jgi:hypothetical protein
VGKSDSTRGVKLGGVGIRRLLGGGGAKNTAVGTNVFVLFVCERKNKNERKTKTNSNEN